MMIRPLSMHEAPAVIRQVKQLLSYAIFQPTEQPLKDIIQSYQTKESLQLTLYVSGDPVSGVLGIRHAPDGAEITHIAVDPTY